MGLPAVGLDDDAVCGPVVVGLAVPVVGRVEGVVDERLGQAGVADQAAGTRLPTRCASTWARVSSLARASLVPRWPLASGDDALRWRGGRRAAGARPARALARARWGARCAARSSSVRLTVVIGMPLVAGGVLGIEGTSAVQADPRGAVAAAGSGDVDARLVGARAGPSARPRCGGSGRRSGPQARTAASRRPSARSAAMADGVDAAVEQVQPPHATASARSHRARARAPSSCARDTTPHCRRRQPRHLRQRGWARLPGTMPVPRAHPRRRRQATRYSGHLRTLTNLCAARATRDLSAARSPAPRSSSARARTAGPRRR